MTSPCVIKIEMSGQHVDVRVDGELSIDGTLDMGRGASEIMRENKCPRLLIDLSNSRLNYAAGGDFGFLDRILSGSFEEISIAVVARTKAVEHIAASINYLDTSHATAKVFDTREVATAWLARPVSSS